MKYTGIIFDYDGTIMDTQTPVHATAEAQVLKKFGINVSAESISQQFAGIPTVQVFQTLAPHVDSEELVNQKWSIVRRIITTQTIRPISGMYQLLEYLYEREIPLVIATASPRWYIEIMMNHSLSVDTKEATLRKYFGDNYISAEEVNNPKPAPDVFFKAAEKINQPYSKCLVVGDGHSDVIGGTAAGMDVVYLGRKTKSLASLVSVSVFSEGDHVCQYIKKLF
jgi:beta-phosphoglucomutase-like phosphatase (HAD superfamily)